MYWPTGSPSGSEAEKLTVACSLPAVATTFAGGVGSPTGVTGVVGADRGPTPIPLVAVTVNV